MLFSHTPEQYGGGASATQSVPSSARLASPHACQLNHPRSCYTTMYPCLFNRKISRQVMGSATASLHKIHYSTLEKHSLRLGASWANEHEHRQNPAVSANVHGDPTGEGLNHIVCSWLSKLEATVLPVPPSGESFPQVVRPALVVDSLCHGNNTAHRSNSVTAEKP